MAYRHGRAETINVSRSIAQQVLRDGVAVLANNRINDERLHTDSLLELRMTSVMCVPLLIVEQKIGVLYLDTNVPGDEFNQDHMQLVRAIAGIASVAIENARHFEWLQSENERLLADVNIEHNMVPVFKEETCFVYEALFNRLIKQQQ